MTAAKVELGRRLFFERRLSGNGTQACADCHRPELAFTDGRGRAVGSTGEVHPRGAMSLVNAAYNHRYNWADPRLDSLERQALVPLLNRHPVEMGLAGRGEEVLARFAADAGWRAAFGAAFPAAAAPVTLENVTRALACFVRTLVSGSSPYDRWVFFGEREALSESARRGRQLFFSARLACGECHSGFNLSGPVVFAGSAPVEPGSAFHNTGLYNLDGAGAYPAADTGLAELTGEPADMGRFRAPTLRNIAVTAPYMHDGSLPTLAAVIDHYAAGGRNLDPDGRRAAAPSPLRDARLRGFSLDDGERRDLLAFLDSLTDPGFLSDPRFADPFPPGERAAIPPLR